MSLFKTFLETLIEVSQPPTPPGSSRGVTTGGPINQDCTLRYVGVVEGAPGVVDVNIRRFRTYDQDVFRINGTITTMAGQWHFDVDGHSGNGKLHDESIVHMEIDQQTLAITINPFDPPAPTYYFRRS